MLLSVFTPSFGATIKTISPLSYGIMEAKTGVDRFNALAACHKEARLKGYSVDYSGIDTLFLDIPKEGDPISLSNNTNFAGVVFVVKNQERIFTLFRLRDYLEPIGNFEDISYCEKLCIGGNYLINIKDEIPWVDNRTGYTYGHYRQDLLFFKDGILQNNPIYEYDTTSSKPSFSICKVNKSKKIIENICFIRDKESSFKTDLIQVYAQNNVLLKNIQVYTPESDLYADAAIQIEFSANITLKDVLIDGTYSQRNKYGYGISLYNVWNVNFYNLKAQGNWGVFCGNNVNKVSLKDCDINRFDIHCYGRDIRFYRCKFSDLYNQFSSVYGNICFDKCEFRHFTPFLIESSYNAYTPLNITWNNCVFYFDKKNNCIINLFGVPEILNRRFELKRKCLPNISLLNSKIVLEDDVADWFLIKTGGNHYNDSFDYINRILIKGVRVYNKQNSVFKIFSEPINYTNQVTIVVRIQYVN